MRILFISNKPPYPKLDGGCVAIADMLNFYIFAGHQVDLVTISTHKHPFDQSAFPQDIRERVSMETVEIDTSINPFDAVAYLFKTGSYNVARFEDDRLSKLLLHKVTTENYDLVHFDSLYTLPYLALIKARKEIPCVYRAHNIEHKIWQEKAEEQGNSLKRSYLNKLSKDLETYEREELDKPDAILPITPNDAQFFTENGFPGLIHIHPVGLEFNTTTSDWDTQPTLFHIGAMDWEPNVHGLTWFMEEVWEKTLAAQPNAELHLAGKALSKSFGEGVAGVYNHGEVPDAGAFITQHEIMVVPLFSGSGLRIKILEAMAKGKLIITTTAGARGIRYEAGKHLLLADTPEDFLQKIKWAFANKADAQEVAEEGKQLAIQFYERNAVYQRYSAFLDKLMTNSKGTQEINS